MMDPFDKRTMREHAVYLERLRERLVQEMCRQTEPAIVRELAHHHAHCFETFGKVNNKKRPDAEFMHWVAIVIQRSELALDKLQAAPVAMVAPRESLH